MAEMSFDEFARKTLERADRLIRAVGIKTFSAIIKDTPVGNPDIWAGHPQGSPSGNAKAPAGYVGGRLRANWRCSLGMADTSTDESTEHRGAIPTMAATCETANRKSTLWLSNSLPYAAKIEYDGHSRQAPEGMVRRNVARIKRILSTELRKLKAIS
jgi:hypothetical protein